MARFRQYKNGIYGHRYKGYYVLKEESDDQKRYTIIDKNKNVILNNINDYWDCEWEIDKLTASNAVTEIIRSLYKEQIYTLSKYFVQLMEKDNTEGLSEEEKELYYWVTKIRARKSENKPY